MLKFHAKKNKKMSLFCELQPDIIHTIKREEREISRYNSMKMRCNQSRKRLAFI